MSDGVDLLRTPDPEAIWGRTVDLLGGGEDLLRTPDLTDFMSPGLQEALGRQIVEETLLELDREAARQEELGRQIVADTLRQQAEEAARQEALGREIVAQTIRQLEEEARRQEELGRLIVEEAVKAGGAPGIPQEQLGREIVERTLAELRDQVGVPAAAAEVVGKLGVDEEPPDIFDRSEEWLRRAAEGVRAECLSVRLPGLPFGEYLATAADWWGQQINDWFGGTVRSVGLANDRVGCAIQEAIGVDVPGGCASLDKPSRPLSSRSGTDDFLVKVPNWEDIFIWNNDRVLDPRDRRARLQDHLEQLQRSPVPLGLREVGELLTTLDDVQDEASTLAVALMIVEKLAGRAIPGVGQVALVADALNVIGEIARPATGSGLPGRRGKRHVNEKAKQSGKGYAGRVDELRRLDKLRIGIGDVLQGLQATESLFGFGVQLGPIFGFLQDAFWGVVRGAEFQFAGPIWDPFGFSEANRRACFRSPRLDQIQPKAYDVLAYESLALWSKAGRILPWVDVLGEQALASVLIGLRMAEQVLGPWLRAGEWQRPLARALEIRERVPGGVRELDTRNVRPDEWLKRTVPASVAAVSRAIANVPDRGRQS